MDFKDGKRPYSHASQYAKEKLYGRLERFAGEERARGTLFSVLGHLAHTLPKAAALCENWGFTPRTLMALSVAEFVERWKAIELTERSAAQSHFIDLCEVLGQQHPAAADHIGDTFTFEKHVSKLHGGKGFADVWKRGFFAWEYKGQAS